MTLSSSAVASAHTFHIPVMGTGFTIDTPIKVARFGITSVISLVDSVLIEQMRGHHARLVGEPYEPIPLESPDSRARTITAYLDLLGRIVTAQSARLRAEPFTPESEITRYFNLLPESAPKQLHRRLLAETNPAQRLALETQLRRLAVPGGIDVNIMTKLDGVGWRGRVAEHPEDRDAMSALRGFALSSLSSAVVFSAGLNRTLYGYAATFADFLPQNGQFPKKRIILKVSDFRSAVVQGTFFAKQGLWLSEFRIESGLNCGGHAFATKGLLMAPILAEFNANRQSLLEELRGLYLAALEKKGITPPAVERLTVRITAQGGIGTTAEDRLLREHYQVEGTGWGTPFLIVPEAVNIDEPTLRLLVAARPADVEMSDNSPLGVPFWNLRTAPSEQARHARIRTGTPGNVCRKGFARFNTEFGSPLCVASNAYQSRKLETLAGHYPDGKVPAEVAEPILTKACICHDLAGGATGPLGIDPEATTAVCPGINIAYFNRVATLDEMVDHIYGRVSLLSGVDRPHMFITELRLYVEVLRRQAEASSREMSDRVRSYLTEFQANLLTGVEHLRQETARYLDERRAGFLQELAALEREINGVQVTA